MPELEPKIAEYKIDIETAEKNLKAFLTIVPPSEGEVPELMADEVFSLLEEKGIKFGLNIGLIRELVEQHKWGEKELHRFPGKMQDWNFISLPNIPKDPR